MNWKRLGPLKLADIIKNTDQEPDFNSDLVKIKTIKFGKAVGYGQFKQGTSKQEGICRVEFNDGEI